MTMMKVLDHKIIAENIEKRRLVEEALTTKNKSISLTFRSLLTERIFLIERRRRMLTTNKGVCEGS